MTPAQIEKLIQDVISIKPASVSEAITNPKDLQNLLAIVEQLLEVLGIFLPEALVVEKVIKLLAVLIPLIEVGAVAFNLHMPTPDTDPLHDAQLSHGGGDLK